MRLILRCMHWHEQTLLMMTCRCAPVVITPDVRCVNQAMGKGSMTLERLQSQLMEYYARFGRDCQPVPIGPLMPQTGGWASTVYTFSLRCDKSKRSSEQVFVLKTYAPTTSGRRKALREWQALVALRAADYPVPRVIVVEQNDRYLGYPFVVMERVPGRPLWHIYEHAEWSTQATLTALFVKQLVALHALAPSVLEAATTHAQPYAFVEHELTQIRRLIQELPYPTLVGVAQWLELRKHTVPCDHPAILHRDYHPWNVLVETTEHCTVIDWDWQIGDFRFDLAWTLTLMRRSGYDAFSQDVRQTYARQSGRSLAGLEYFEVLATLRWLLNVMHALQSGEALRDSAQAGFRDFLVEPTRNAVAFLQEGAGVQVQLDI